MKQVKKVFSVISFMALTLAAAPTTALAEVAISTDPSAALTASPNLNGRQVYFGSYVTPPRSSDIDYGAWTDEYKPWIPTGDVAFSDGPVKWNVVERGDGTATLWTATRVAAGPYYLDQYASRDNFGEDFWLNSPLCAWLNGTGNYSSNGFLPGAFKPKEQTAIKPYGTTEIANSYGYESMGIDTLLNISSKLVVPSIAELSGNRDWDGEGNQIAPDSGTWNIDQYAYTFIQEDQEFWWLRSPTPVFIGNGDGPAAGYVLSYNYTDAYKTSWVAPSGNADGGQRIEDAYAIRPAFKLDMSAVIFTSAAYGAGSKSAATLGGGLFDASAPASTDEVKLTLKDESLSLTCLNTSAKKAKAGDMVSIPYAGAQTGENKYVSCVVTDSGSKALYYGKLADTASGTASFKVPAGLSEGSYTIKLFNRPVLKP